VSCLLVSFCNLSQRGPALGVFDFDSEHFAWIYSNQQEMLWHGVDGICQRAGAYWFLPQVAWEGISALARLGEDPILRFYGLLTETRDAHSLVPYQDGFLVADTRRNRLMYIEPSRDHTVRETEYWKYCQAERDVVHVNSIARLGSDIYVSLLGEKPADGWAHAVNGMILNISRSEVICRGLIHPHSLLNIQDSLYWLESGTGTLLSFSPAQGLRVVARLKNYVRGLTYDDAYIYVGASGSRPVSRSTGLPNPPIDPEADEACSWIYRLHRGDLSIERKRSPSFRREIYDLASICPAHAAVYFKGAHASSESQNGQVRRKESSDEASLSPAA
jgi:hypothetical protein